MAGQAVCAAAVVPISVFSFSAFQLFSFLIL
jgi:hypothetical protein